MIGNLHSANLRTIMITGDNINTAISVAKECGIIKTGGISWPQNVQFSHLEHEVDYDIIDMYLRLLLLKELAISLNLKH